MRLRNVLIVVNDMDGAIRFYKEIFGLQVILDQDGNDPLLITEHFADMTQDMGEPGYDDWYGWGYLETP